MADQQQKQSSQAEEFAKESQQGSRGLGGELWDFLRYNKKWWLTPIIISLLLIGVLVAFGTASGAAPFIYTLF